MNFKKVLHIVGLLITVSIFHLSCEKEVKQQNIDPEILQLMTKYNLPSIAACVIKDNEVVWEEYYGYSNIQDQVKASEETIYHIGSISKLFIVTAIMQLEEQGEINLDDDINEYLPINFRNPYFPETPITTRILLTHTSGLAWPQVYTEALGIWEHFKPDQAPPLSVWIPQFLIPGGIYYNKNSWKQTEPGTFELYSNIGSCVLAYIVEQISGHDFKKYCKEHIFIPLNLQNTSYNLTDLDADKIALFYNENNAINNFFDDRIYASGNLKTTISDLSRFVISYLNKGDVDGNRILKEVSIQKMFKVHNEASGLCLIWNASIGGWFGHTGGMDAGATSTLEINPENNTAFIIFCNKSPSSIFPGQEIYGLVRQKANECSK